MFRCAMLTCDHIFLPYFSSPLFYVVSSSRPILSSTNLTWKNFQDALSESKPKMILLQFACIQWPMKLLLKDPGAGFFFLSGWFLSCRPMVLARYVTALAPVSRPVGPLFFYRVVASFGRFAQWSCIDKQTGPLLLSSSELVPAW